MCRKASVLICFLKNCEHSIFVKPNNLNTCINSSRHSQIQCLKHAVHQFNKLNLCCTYLCNIKQDAPIEMYTKANEPTCCIFKSSQN